MSLKTPLTALVMLLTAAAPSEAATQLTYLIGGKPTALVWQRSSFPLEYSIDAEAASRIPGSTGTVAQSFAAWEDRATAVTFAAPATGRVKAGRDSINAVSISPDLMENSGFLAYTTTWFDDRGSITEADIQIDDAAAASPGVRALIAHEAGHLLGFDHSAVVSAAMYPFITDGAPQLDSDDRTALMHVYRREITSPDRASIAGRVVNAMGGVFGAQVVAVNSSGSPVASALTDSDGSFRIDALSAGQYRIYAEPLDGPVESRNLSGVWAGGSSRFRTQFHGTAITVAEGQAASVELRVEDLSARLNPKWIGVMAPDAAGVSLSSMPATLRAGDIVVIAVGGDGFIGGTTKFQILNSGIARASDFSYGANYVSALFRVPAETSAGSMVVVVDNGDEQATLTGALRLMQPVRQRAARR